MPTIVNGTGLDDLIDFSFIVLAGNSISGADDFVFGKAGDDYLHGDHGNDFLSDGSGSVQ